MLSRYLGPEFGGAVGLLNALVRMLGYRWVPCYLSPTGAQCRPSDRYSRHGRNIDGVLSRHPAYGNLLGPPNSRTNYFGVFVSLRVYGTDLCLFDQPSLPKLNPSPIGRSGKFALPCWLHHCISVSAGRDVHPASRSRDRTKRSQLCRELGPCHGLRRGLLCDARPLLPLCGGSGGSSAVSYERVGIPLYFHSLLIWFLFPPIHGCPHARPQRRHQRGRRSITRAR